uniref:TSA: Wollemia nobilis Ref_Wollemi_Transcript_23574_1089 transcribed RNA sequence n=1 Tax=Wollemia nobilis TaxID=56998 RepID=A0A0C9RQK1_9CONI
MKMDVISLTSSFPKVTTHSFLKFSPLQPVLIPRKLKILKHGKKRVVCCSDTHDKVNSYEVSGNGRRQAVCQIVALFSALNCIHTAPGAAEPEADGDYDMYKDEADKFSLLIPREWVKGKGRADQQRMVTAFYPESDEVSNVNVVITGLGPDYTKMESFGNVDAFAETLVNGLDRSWKRPPGQAAKLLNAKSKNGMYYVEYSLQKPGQSKIRLFSAVGMAFNGWYNRLYTATGQYLEEDADKYKAKIEKSISSFKII